jgi:hypothetical protein
MQITARDSTDERPQYHFLYIHNAPNGNLVAHYKPKHKAEVEDALAGLYCLLVHHYSDEEDITLFDLAFTADGIVLPDEAVWDPVTRQKVDWDHDTDAALEEARMEFDMGDMLDAEVEDFTLADERIHRMQDMGAGGVADDMTYSTDATGATGLTQSSTNLGRHIQHLRTHPPPPGQVARHPTQNPGTRITLSRGTQGARGNR